VVTTMPKRIASSDPDPARDPLLVFGGVDTHAIPIPSRRSAISAHCWVMRASAPAPRAIGGSTAGLPVTARLSGSGWKAPAPMALGLPRP
jgi:hypothetical protein